MKLKIVIAAAGLLTAAAAPAANAIGIGAAGGGGTVNVHTDLGACATLSFSGPTTAAGQFTAVAEIQGPGTRVGTVRSTIPIVLVNQSTWSGCIPGAYSGATAGEGKYTLTVDSPKGDFADVTQCTVAFGVVTCH